MESVTTSTNRMEEGILNIVLFAASSDQEFANLDREIQYKNDWNNTPTYDNHSYENIYNQTYVDGRYLNTYTNSSLAGDLALSKEVPVNLMGIEAEVEEKSLGVVLKIRNDGFVHNFVNDAIFYADQNAVTLLERLSELTIGQVKLERPDVFNALMF